MSKILDEFIGTQICTSQRREPAIRFPPSAMLYKLGFGSALYFTWMKSHRFNQDIITPLKQKIQVGTGSYSYWNYKF